MSARISQFLKREIEIMEPGVAKVSIPFNPDLTQNSDYLHGAIFFEAADTAGFIASNSLEQEFSVLTANFSINLIRPVQKEGIYAIAEVIHRGRSLIVAQSKVYSNSGKLVATGQGTYMVSKVPLSAVKEYE